MQVSTTVQSAGTKSVSRRAAYAVDGMMQMKLETGAEVRRISRLIRKSKKEDERRRKSETKKSC